MIEAKSKPSGIELSTETDDRSERRIKSRRTRFLQGTTVFVVMAVTLYTILLWVTSREESQEESDN